MQKSINVFANEAQKAISVECYDSRPFIAPLKVGTRAELQRLHYREELSFTERRDEYCTETESSASSAVLRHDTSTSNLNLHSALFAHS